MFTYKVNYEIDLQLLQLTDAEEVYSLLDKDRVYLREWLPWVDDSKTVNDTRTFIQSGLNQFAAGNGFQAGIRYKKRFVGLIGFHGINRANRTTSIGYWLGKSFQGKGIMTEACKAMLHLAFHHYGINRVEIRAATDNYKSRAIPERLGFQNEGCIRQVEWLYDHFVDHVVYGMLAHHWELRRDMLNRIEGV